MDLIAVKKYLQGCGQRVTLKDVALHFRQDTGTVRPLLDVWVGKGKVRRTEAQGCGKGCCQCDAETLEIYEWIG